MHPHCHWCHGVSLMIFHCNDKVLRVGVGVLCEEKVRNW